MILTGKEILRQVEKNRITISPFDPSNINPNSYNYHLGQTYIEVASTEALDLRTGQTSYEEKEIPHDGLVLYPGRLYLCNTQEVIGSSDYVTSLIGKSSMGRLGLFLQISADLGHQGEIHKWTLEMKACIPLRIYPLMVIGQVTFWNVLGLNYDSKGYYASFDGPTASKGVLT